MSYKVTIEPTGDVIKVEKGRSILDASLRSGVYLPHACSHGLCATCKIEVLEGEVEHGDASPFALMDMERDEGKCLACCATPTTDLTIEADIEEDEDAKNYPVRDFIAEVIEIKTLTPRIKAIFIKIQNDAVEFQAGQYINLLIPGMEDRPRAFSIANPPSEKNIIELNVCLIEGGKGTSYLHNELKIGNEIRFNGPYGRFFVRQSQPEPMIFLAGGSGLSSVKSMILDLFEQNETREIALIYGARSRNETYYYELFTELANKHKNFTYMVAVSREDIQGSDWSGKVGFVHEALKERFNGSFSGYKAYICGPPPMVDACITTLMEGRLFERDMYMENFYTQASKNDKTKSPLFKNL